MNSALRQIVAPITLPLTVAQAKAHCRVTTAADDSYIEQLIRVAVNYAEDRTGTAIGRQTWEMHLSEFHVSPYAYAHEYGHTYAYSHTHSAITIPKPPLIDVLSIQYKPPGLGYSILATTEYVWIDSGTYGEIQLSPNGAWPSIESIWNAVKITFECGYLSAPLPIPEPRLDLPARLRHALLVMIAEMYDRRADAQDGVPVRMQGAIDALLRPSRVRIW